LVCDPAETGLRVLRRRRATHGATLQGGMDPGHETQTGRRGCPTRTGSGAQR
jgi:hypothetical protein